MFSIVHDSSIEDSMIAEVNIKSDSEDEVFKEGKITISYEGQEI